MSVQQEHATSETATLTTTESGGVYQSLFDKINLTPVPDAAGTQGPLCTAPRRTYAGQRHSDRRAPVAPLSDRTPVAGQGC